MINEAKERFTRYLKEGKFRITPERFIVMNYALEYIGHFGADELFIKMKNDKSTVSRATVYNTLDLLSNCDLLSTRHFGDKIKRYESNFNRKTHDHVICDNCGKIKEFSNEIIQTVIDKVSEELDFEVTHYSFNIYGKCKDHEACKRNKNQ